MLKRVFFAMTLILAIALVACGGGDEPSEPGQPADTSGSAADSATAVAEPPTATPAEPTATPEPPPTPTLAPTPTETAEAAQPAEEPDTAGTSSDDSGSAAATTGSGWGASGSGAQSACDHPYLPIRTGSTWTYENSEGTVIWEVVDVQGDLNEATAVLDVTVGDITLNYHWQCAAGEGLSSFDFANLTSAPVGLDMTIEQVSVDGQFLLPAEQMVPGASWTAEMLGTISFSQEIEGTTLEATGDMKTVQEHTIVSADPVEFEGQSVPGLQVEQRSTLTIMISLMGTGTEQVTTIGSNYNLGYGIGIVNQSSVTDFGTETMNLVAYSIP